MAKGKLAQRWAQGRDDRPVRPMIKENTPPVTIDFDPPASLYNTVLDAILLAGLKSNSLPEKAYLVRPHPLGGHDQVLKIDWCGIRERGDTPMLHVRDGNDGAHRLYRLMILVPLVIPGLIGALGLLLFWGSRGWFNLFLLQFAPFITSPVRVNYTIHGLIFFYVWLYFPYTCVTTMSALESLDPSIEEAGAVVGANRWQVLRYVVLPLITPGILAGSVLTFMAAFGAFSVPLIAGGDYRPLAVEIYKQISIPIPARWSAASAIAMVMGILQVVFLTVYMRLVRHAGGNARGAR